MHAERPVAPAYEPGAHAGQTPTPVPAEARPVAQLEQKSEPMRATGPCAVSCVAAQRRHAVAFSPCMYWPPAHGAHTLPAAGENLPGTHCEHDVWPSRLDSKPAEHCKQVETPNAVEYDPLAHLSHDERPVTLANVPETQFVHCDRRGVKANLPTAQARQADAPVVFEKRPAGHSRHSCKPVTSA